MSLPTNKQIKDLYDGLLGRPCTIGDAADQLSPDASPAPAYAVLDAEQRMLGVVLAADVQRRLGAPRRP